MEDLIDPLPPSRAKRGCLWYIAVVAASMVGIGLFWVAVLVFSPDKLSQQSILVSDNENTYLEAVDKYIGGFMDTYYVLAFYYTQAGGWFRPARRVWLKCDALNSTADLGFRRRFDANGQFQIEVKRPKRYEEIKDELMTRTPEQSQAHFSLPSGIAPGSVEDIEFRTRARLAAGDSVVIFTFVPPAKFPGESAARADYHDPRECPGQ